MNLAKVEELNEKPLVVHPRKLPASWIDEKVMAMIETKGEKISEIPNENRHGILIKDILLSKKQIREVYREAMNVYGRLYAKEVPNYAKRYPNETQIEFMKRWNTAIEELKKLYETSTLDEKDTLIHLV